MGIVISSEVSRLSRNLSEWGRLFELCGDTDTLIADAESLYDLKLPNDRFLLGLICRIRHMIPRLIAPGPPLWDFTYLCWVRPIKLLSQMACRDTYICWYEPNTGDP